MNLIESILCFLLLLVCSILSAQDNIPLPEHPRPDFERTDWINLNGSWKFTFNQELASKAIQSGAIDQLDMDIRVPFGWGSKLSGVPDGGDIGWYGREVQIPEEWKGKRVYLVVGASEWDTQVWFDGQELGSHRGGYTPFEFELTDRVQSGKKQNLIVRADDTASDQRLDGKQGYGNVRGIWQTVYLEARGHNFVDYIHYSPDIDRSLVKVTVGLKETPAKDTQVRLHFKNGEQADFIHTPKGKTKNDLVQEFEVKLENQRLWDLDNPYLYEMEAALVENNQAVDVVHTYFGQRKIGVEQLPGTDYPYVALNNKPVYMQLCLDQSYHPDGFYTFPSDAFMRDEILLSKSLGLNGNRIHIKVEVPRKLYWADKLGLLIMADVPNWWGEPTDKSKADWEHCMRNQIRRDYNHPSIFSWVNFNETWGLASTQNGEHAYHPDTQEWVREMYHLSKKLDPTRLVEDHSPDKYDHVESDLNTWHRYLPGYRWKEYLADVVEKTYPGSTYNYIGGNKQGENVPMFNSECGNVWGYDGSAGDSDYTWDYHIMINEFRSHPKVAGWLYTEHHDVINEWNGYVRYDRSPKYDGLSAFVPGMGIADFHSLYYIAPRGELFREVKAGEKVETPLFVSFMTDKNPGRLTLETHLIGWNTLGHEIPRKAVARYPVEFKPFRNELIDPATVTMPQEAGVYALQMELKNETGKVMGRNFVLLRVKEGKLSQTHNELIVSSTPANAFTGTSWSLKQWDVLGGRKVNGAGHGYFEYEIPWPDGLSLDDIETASFNIEISAKELFGKDMDDADLTAIDLDYMRGAVVDMRKSKNAYAMSDREMFPSHVNISVNGTACGEAYLPDDPADHRGVLSWAAQPRDNTMHEAGSYGYLIETVIPREKLVEGEPIKIRLEVLEGMNGGIAVYGKDFGRFPLDPTVVFTKKRQHLAVASALYTNPLQTSDGTPVRMGDPFAYEHNGVYYLTGTTGLPEGEGFAYYTSSDLITWEYKGALYRKPENHIGTTAFWAPEVKYYKGWFYLSYSCYVPTSDLAETCLAVSDNPWGPFEDLYTPWVDFGYSVIDSHIFVDDDDIPYLYFSRNDSGDGIGIGTNYVVRLKKNLSGADGEPRLVSEASQPWEKVNWEKNRCNEGPFVLKHNGTYYMTYSANDTGYEFYGVGVATAKHPLGSWTKYADNPLMTTDLSRGISSPGHNSIITSPEGNLYIIYHRHADAHCEKPNWDRVVCMDRIYFDETGKLKIAGPTNAIPHQ